MYYQIRQQHDISASRQKLLNETQQRLDETQEKLNEFNHLSTQLDQIETHNKKVQGIKLSHSQMVKRFKY